MEIGNLYYFSLLFVVKLCVTYKLKRVFNMNEGNESTILHNEKKEEMKNET
jgi:hypothetical protein